MKHAVFSFKKLYFRLIKLFSEKDVYYINGPDTLPPPFTAAEEAEILSRLV